MTFTSIDLSWQHPAAWRASALIPLDNRVYAQCPQCWERRQLVNRIDVAAFMAGLMKCEACGLQLEKSDYWPFPMTAGELQRSRELEARKRCLRMREVKEHV